MTAAFVQRGHLGSGQRSGARRTSQGTRSRQRTSSQKPGEKPTATTLISNLRPPDWDGAFPPLKAPRLRSLVRAAPGHPRPKGRLFAAGEGAPQLVFLWPCGHGHPAAQAMGERRAGLQPPAAAGGRAAGLSPGPGHQPPRPGPSRPSARARLASGGPKAWRFIVLFRKTPESGNRILPPLRRRCAEAPPRKRRLHLLMCTEPAQRRRAAARERRSFRGTRRRVYSRPLSSNAVF